MARIPIYTNNANFRPAGANEIRNIDHVAHAVDNLGRTIGDLTVQWQRTQNAAEALNGKNKMMGRASDILQEAADFNEYDSPAKLQEKENELLDKMDKVLPEITDGFTNDRNAQRFGQEYQLTMEQNKQALKSTFRKKYIDLSKAELLVSYETNKDNFVNTGDNSYRQSYLSDVRAMFKAGYIDAEDMAQREIRAKNWNFDYAESEALQRPEETLADLKRFDLDAKDTQRVKDIAESILKKRKDAIKNGKTEEEAMEISMTQQINKQMFEDQWKADKGKIQKDMNSIFEFRNAIQEKFMANDLSQKDYAKLQADTIAPLLEKVKNHSAGNPIWWNTSFDEAVLGVEKKVDLENANDEVKAYVYDLVYSSLKERNIDPDKRFGRDDKAIGEIVENVSAEYLRNKEPNLLGVEANKVLLGTKMFDYKLNGGGKEVKPQKYQLMQDKNGVRYKVYADKDGKYTDNSIMERVQ